MISETCSVWIISLLSLFGIIYFVVIAFVNKFANKDKLTGNDFPGGNDYDDDERKVLEATGQQFLDFKSSVGQRNKKKNEKAYENQEIINQFIEVSNIYFLRQTIFMLPFALLSWLLFYASFSARFSIFWSIVSMLYGIVCVGAVAFIALRFTINSTVRFLNESLESRGRAYSFGWVSGVAIAAGILSITLFLVNDIIPLAKNTLKDENLTDSDSMTKFFFTIMSFVWGILSGALFYRQIGQEVGKGLTSGSDLIGCDRKDHYFTIRTQSDEIIQQGKLLGNIISQSLTNIIDLTIVISLLVVVFGVVLCQSPDLLALEDQAPIYFPSFALIICIILQLLLSVLAFGKKSVNDMDQNMTPATFTAKNNLLQVILANVLNIFVLIFVPLYFFPNTEFSIGNSEYPGFQYEKITSYTLVWCAEIGLFTQATLLFIGEYYTSNAFKPTKEIAQNQLKSLSQGQNVTHLNCSIAQGLTLLTLGLSVMLCYLFGGFIGLGCGLVGLLSTPIILVTNSIFGDLAYGGNILAKLDNISSEFTRNVRNMAKGALNYQIYLQFINASAVFYINIILIGLIAYFTKSQSVQIWETWTIFGLFIGSAMAYILKASSTAQIHLVQKDVQSVEPSNDTQQYGYNENTPFSFKSYIFEKIATVPMVRVIVHLVGTFILLIFLAYVFGYQTVMGYIIGLNLVGLHISLYSILVQNATRNARLLNEEQQGQLEQGQRNTQGVQNSVESDIQGQTCENNSLLIYLIINTLYIMMGSLQFWTQWGAFGKYLNNNYPSIASSSVGIWDWMIIGSGNSGDGENTQQQPANNDGETA